MVVPRMLPVKRGGRPPRGATRPGSCRRLRGECATESGGRGVDADGRLIGTPHGQSGIRQGRRPAEPRSPRRGDARRGSARTSVQPSRRAGRPCSTATWSPSSTASSHVVRHEHPRGRVLGHHSEQPDAHLRARDRVEAPEGLVEQDEPAVHQERARQRDALAHPARELARAAPSRASPRPNSRSRSPGACLERAPRRAPSSAAPRSGRARPCARRRSRCPAPTSTAAAGPAGTCRPRGRRRAVRAPRPARPQRPPPPRRGPPLRQPAAALRRARCSSVLLPQPLRPTTRGSRRPEARGRGRRARAPPASPPSRRLRGPRRPASPTYPAARPFTLRCPAARHCSGR